MKRKRTPSTKQTKKVPDKNKTIFDYFQVKSPSTPNSQESVENSPQNTETPPSSQNSLEDSQELDSQEFIFKTPVKTEKIEEVQKEEEEEYVPSYYLTNFFIIFDTVMEKDTLLFNEQEIEILKKFKQLHEQSQRIFIRLFHRRREWFQVKNLKYKEINNMEECIFSLEKEKFIESFDQNVDYTNEEMESLLSLLTNDELKSNISPVLKKGNLTRIEILKVLLATPKVSVFNQKIENKTLKKLTSKLGKCVRISNEFKEIINRMNYLFFLNESQDSTSLLLHDMKIVEFPSYEYKPTSLFQSRDHFMGYMESQRISRLFSQYSQEKNLEKILETVDFALNHLQSNNIEMDKSMLNVFLVKFTPGYIYSYLIHHSVEIFEKNKMYEKSVDLLNMLLSLSFLKHKRGKWWNRLAQDLQHLKQDVQRNQLTNHRNWHLKLV
jgi:hypothetical protein